MIVGILTVALTIPGANSLKDKRHVIKGLLEGVRQKFNISAAEVGENDSWRRATLGMACVSNDRRMANRILDKVVDYVESNPVVSIASVEMEFM